MCQLIESSLPPQGWLPVHCAASHGLTPAIEALLGCDSEGELTQRLRENSSEVAPVIIIIVLHICLGEPLFMFSLVFGITFTHSNHNYTYIHTREIQVYMAGLIT